MGARHTDSARSSDIKSSGIEPTGIEAKPDPAVDRHDERVSTEQQPGSFVPVLGLATGRHEEIRTGLRALGALPKLIVGSADDEAEVAADALADAVVHRLQTMASGMAGPARDDADVRQPTDVVGSLRRAAAQVPAPGRRQPGGAAGAVVGPAGGEVAADTEQALRGIRRTGVPLPGSIRRDYEAALGTDLSAVRVHAGAASARLNAALGARAFTVGSDIYFGNRMPSMSDPGDRHLLAHELAHTLQDGGSLQDGGAVQRAMVRRLAVQLTVGSAKPQAPKPGPDEGLPVTPREAETASSDSLMTDSHASVETPILGSSPAVEDGLADASMIASTPALAEGAPAEAGPVITKLSIVGRPDKLFGSSMGDHMTAFVVHRKGIAHAVVNKPLPDAITAVNAIIDDLPKLPGWGLIESLKPPTVEAPTVEVPGVEGVALPTEDDTHMAESSGSDGKLDARPASALPKSGAGPVAETGVKRRKLRASHYDRFVASRDKLEISRALLAVAPTPDEQLLRLQDCIAGYLKLRELVPLSVADWKGSSGTHGGRGDGEPPLHGLTGAPGSQDPGLLRHEFLATIAIPRIAQAAVEPNAETLAALMPGLSPDLTADERTEVMARQHVQSVLTNFGANFAALADAILPRSGAEASTSMEDEEKKSGEPAPRTQEENFKVVLDHLVGIVQQHYEEAAAAGYEYYCHCAKVMANDVDRAGQARADAEKLAKLLPKSYSKSVAPEPVADAVPSKRRRSANRHSAAAFEELTDPSHIKEKKKAESAKAQQKKKRKGRDSFTGPARIRSEEPAPDLAVQLIVDADGKILDAKVERAGKHTKGAHTTPWTRWARVMTADIRDKAPAAALAAFRSKTVPKIQGMLQVHLSTPVDTAPASSAPLESLLDGPAVLGEPGLLGEPSTGSAMEAMDVEAVGEPAVGIEPVADDPLPLMQLQAEMSAMFEFITASEGVTVLDAVDTGYKGEGYHRDRLRAFENDEVELSEEECFEHILGLCDVVEADDDTAANTIKLALKEAEENYSKAYALSGIAKKPIPDLVSLAKAGKDRDYEDDGEAGGKSPESKRRKKKEEVL